MRVHIFIFVRRCDLHFTLLLHLFRQVKANELLMNKSVKYSPPAQLPIQMLLISGAFCAVFSYRVPNVGLQARSTGRDKHPEPGQQQEGGVLGTPDFPAWSAELVSSEPDLLIEGNYELGGISTSRGQLGCPPWRAKKPGPEPTPSFFHSGVRVPGSYRPPTFLLPLKENNLHFATREGSLCLP